MDCENCNRTPETVDYYTHEGMMARLTYIIKRLWILVLVLVLLLVGSNIAWIIYEAQFEDQVITQEISQSADGTGSNSYSGKIVGGDYNGEADDQDNG